MYRQTTFDLRPNTAGGYMPRPHVSALGLGETPAVRQTLYDPQYNRAGGTVETYRGTPHTVAKMTALAKGPRGEHSIRVRRHAEQIVGGLRAKDYSSEVIGIGNYWARAGRYTRDPLHIEMLRDPERMVDDAEAGKLACDCDEYALAIGTSCMCVGAEIEFVTVGFRPPVKGQDPIFTHVFCRAKDPRTGVWWVLDPVAGRRTNEMLSRVKQYRIYRV